MDMSQSPAAHQARRAASLLLAGGAFSIAVLAISQASGGFLGAAGFLLAIAAVAISFGIFAETAGGLIAAGNLRRDEDRCGACAGRKAQLGSIWVCRTCDHIES